MACRFGGRKAEGRRKERAEGRRQRAEGRGQRAEGRGQKEREGWDYGPTLSFQFQTIYVAMGSHNG